MFLGNFPKKLLWIQSSSINHLLMMMKWSDQQLALLVMVVLED